MQVTLLQIWWRIRYIDRIIRLLFHSNRSSTGSRSINGMCAGVNNFAPSLLTVETDPHLTNAVPLNFGLLSRYRELPLVPLHLTILLIKNCSFSSTEFVANCCEERSGWCLFIRDHFKSIRVALVARSQEFKQ